MPKLYVVVILASLAAIAVLLFKMGLDLPTVQVSTSTGRCVQVITPEPSPFTCGNLPRKYNQEYVR